MPALCKIADAEVLTDALIWKPVGSAGPIGPSASRSHGQPAPSTVKGADSPGPGANSSDDEARLKQRISDIESRRGPELEQARQTGFEQGMKQARQEAAGEIEGALDRLACAVQDVALVKKRVRAQAETELVRLSLSIAKRILHRELTTDAQSLRGIVYAALQHLQNREITRVRVFPGGVAALRAALERNGGGEAIEIVADGHMQPGDLVFETPLGELDASVETQLQEIERGFADKLQTR